MDKLVYDEIMKTINFTREEISFVNEKEYLVDPVIVNNHLNEEEKESHSFFVADIENLNEMSVEMETLIIDILIEKIKRFVSLQEPLDVKIKNVNFKEIITDFPFASENYQRLLYSFDYLKNEDILELVSHLNIKQKYALYTFDMIMKFYEETPKIMIAVKKELNKFSYEELNNIFKESNPNKYYNNVSESFYNNDKTKKEIVQFEKELLNNILGKNTEINERNFKKRI